MYKPLADSTLMGMTKKDIIEQLRIAEHNYQAVKETVNQQAENFIKILAEERKHGHWELTEDTISCPFCDYWNLRKKEQRNGVYVYSKTPNYCPNCGAEMESTK